jgi:cytochrome c biogenesis protein
MAAEARPTPHAPLGPFSPFRWLWDLLTNVKFALVLVGTALGASFLGVLIPQMPGPMRANPAARSAWLELQREDFGALTTPMDRLALFEIFHSNWFIGLWVVIIAAVTVCTISRFRPTARSVHRPPRVVPDRYFETARYRASMAGSPEATEIEGALRRRRYQVSRPEQGADQTSLFADRYPWSAYGTFLSHLALLILLVGGVLTAMAGFSETLALAETTPSTPVFREPGPDQLFVRMVDAVRGVDEQGNVVDFRSHLEVRRGDETITCTTTVNDPCHAFGYRLHQAAFFNDVARLKVEGPGGEVLYDDVFDFDSETTVVPVFRITDSAGQVVFGQEVPQMGTDPGSEAGRGDDVAIANLVLPSSAEAVVALDISWRVQGEELVVVAGGPGIQPQRLDPGESMQAGGLTVTRVGSRVIPAREVLDMPGAVGGRAVVQMPADNAGEAYLFVTGLGAENAVVREGRPYVSPDGYRYTFSGRVEAAGIDVRRDPGDTFIWVAAGMALAGLGITFYVPRRRLWVKVTGDRAWFAGMAEKTARLDRELAKLVADLQAPKGTGSA